MANTYFKFKQFTIHQENCAMKVSTDACILGAWFSEKDLHAKKILDIGSGTGLLMLMLAQKQDTTISGIEIDSNCFTQLKENIENSKWKQRLVIYNGDVRNFEIAEKFDFIVSNPPFYENSLKAEIEEVNLARHGKELRLEELLTAIDRLLSNEGSFGVLIPYSRSLQFEKLAAIKNFHLAEKLLVRQSPNHNFFRSILYYSRKKQSAVKENELVIVEGEGQYTKEFIELLNEYYLYL